MVFKKTSDDFSINITSITSIYRAESDTAAENITRSTRLISFLASEYRRSSGSDLLEYSVTRSKNSGFAPGYWRYHWKLKLVPLVRL